MKSIKSIEKKYDLDTFPKFMKRKKKLVEHDIEFYNDIITDSSVSLLTNITSLDLFYNDTITDSSLSLLTNIINLNLYCNDTITESSFSLLTNSLRPRGAYN